MTESDATGARPADPPRSDPDPADPRSAEEFDAAVDAAEQHQRAEEDADAGEHVVVRDPETGRIAEEPAQ